MEKIKVTPAQFLILVQLAKNLAWQRTMFNQLILLHGELNKFTPAESDEWLKSLLGAHAEIEAAHLNQLVKMFHRTCVLSDPSTETSSPKTDADASSEAPHDDSSEKSGKTIEEILRAFRGENGHSK